MGGGGEVRTQRLVHDEGDDSATGGRGTGGGAVSRWCKMAHLASSPLGCSQGSSPQGRRQTKPRLTYKTQNTQTVRWIVNVEFKKEGVGGIKE